MKCQRSRWVGHLVTAYNFYGETGGKQLSERPTSLKGNIKMNNRCDFLMAMRSKLRVCGRSLAGIAGSNLAGVIDVCLFCEY